MIQIKEDCQAQAANMLRTQATEIGRVGGWHLYILDGKVWAISRPEGVVFRSDDDVETQIIQRLCRNLRLQSAA